MGATGVRSVVRSAVRPTTRPAARQSAAAPAPGGHPLAQYLGAGSVLIDGSSTLARYYTDAAGTALCATSLTDPVGNVLDLSGSSTPISKSTSGAKPRYKVASGFKILQLNRVSALLPGQELVVGPIDIQTTSAFYAVLKWSETTPGLDGLGPIFGSANGSCAYEMYNGYDQFQHSDLGGIKNVHGVVIDGAAGVVKAKCSPTQIDVWSSTTVGGSLNYDAAAGTPFSASAVDMRIGSTATGHDMVELAFMCYANGGVSVDGDAAILAYINTQFAGGW